MLQLGQATTLKALGRTYTVGRLELRIVRAFKEWVRDRLDDPLSLPEHLFKLLPADEQIARVKRHEDVNRQIRNFSLQCPLAREFLQTEEGMAELARLLLEAHHPGITADEAFSVFVEAGPQFQAALAAAAGQLPGGQDPGNGRDPATRPAL